MHQKYLELALVFDHSRYIFLNSNLSRVINDAILLSSIMDTYFQDVRMRIHLTGVEVWTDEDKIRLTYPKLEQVLGQFMVYRTSPWLSLRLCAPRESGPEAHSWRRPSETPEAAQDGYRGEQCQGRANGPGPRTPKGLGSRWGKGTPDAGVPRGRAPRYATPLRSRDTRGNGVEFLWAHPKMADKREAQLSGLLCLGAAGLCPGLLELLPPPAGPAGRPRPSGPPTAPTDRPRCPAPLQGEPGA